jgi:hypothetical protein
MHVCVTYLRISREREEMCAEIECDYWLLDLNFNSTKIAGFYKARTFSCSTGKGGDSEPGFSLGLLKFSNLSFWTESNRTWTWTWTWIWNWVWVWVFTQLFRNKSGLSSLKPFLSLSACHS